MWSADLATSTWASKPVVARTLSIICASTGFCLSCIDTVSNVHRLSGHPDGINKDYSSTLSKNEAHLATPYRGHNTETMVSPRWQRSSLDWVARGAVCRALRSSAMKSARLRLTAEGTVLGACKPSWGWFCIQRRSTLACMLCVEAVAPMDAPGDMQEATSSDLS
jgi:hypothetical protein